MAATDHRLGRRWWSELCPHARHHGSLSRHDREFEPLITIAFNTGRAITDTLDGPLAFEVSDTYGQFAHIHLNNQGVVRP